MSLTPSAYDSALAVVTTLHCSVLVFEDSLAGEGPGGCDGWSLFLNDGKVTAHYLHGPIFPPEDRNLSKYYPRHGDLTEEARNRESKQLAHMIQIIRATHSRLAKQPRTSNPTPQV